MTDDPAEYPWSIFQAHCDRLSDAMLTPHPAYTALGSEPEVRCEAYRLLLREALPDDDLLAIRTYLQQQRALGRDDFRVMVEAKTQRFAGTSPAHRPRDAGSNGCK